MYDLNRFKEAQAINYKDALEEIKNGRKESCWMWYVFPQIKGLGQSSTAKYFEMESLEEAKAYLRDALLNSHLQEICKAALECPNDNPVEVFGFPDCLKFCSSMTLFEQADKENPIYGKLLEKYYHGKRDERTLAILKEQC